MDVIYSLGVRFGKGGGIGNVSARAVRAIQKRGFLKRLIVSINESTDIEHALVREVKLPRVINKGLYLSGFGDTERSAIIDPLFDQMAVRHVTGCDIFHGWGNFSLKCVKKAKALGAVTVIERASSHPKNQNMLLEEEYRRFLGKGYIDDKVKKIEERALAEFAECDHITVPSAFAAESMVKFGVDEKKILLLPFGVDVDRFRPVEKQDKVFRLLFMGQVSIRKGIPYLLEAWSGLKLKQAELVIVGTPAPDVKEVIEKYGGDPTIRFIGHTPDYARLYGETSVFVFPSIEEGSALVTYEAMACGLPSITTYNSGTVARDGIDGFIIPAKDVSALKDKILTLYEDREKLCEMGLSARKRIEGFTWDDYGDRLVKSYENILSNKAYQQTDTR